VKLPKALFGEIMEIYYVWSNIILTLYGKSGCCRIVILVAAPLAS